MCYDYDIHGNVEKLVQQLPELDPKTVEYSYDLLSGNVHRVTYQKGETDQFMHRYAYDADNRLEAVFTSSDGYIWDEDARYLYYAHGPMARVELGEYKVQGVDYYYTLQGWIKGVNLQGDHDAEATNNVQKYVSKDAFGYALHYYQNDYQSINGNFGWNANNTTDLFNGNIAAMSTTLKTAGENVMLYKYDQLNRIKTAVSSQNTYQTGYSYDANGNILSLLRNDHNNATIDNLSYTYNTTQNNRLNKLRDNSNNNTGFTSSSTPFSYQYDNIGNLIEDEEKDITSIKWTVYGKVASVTKNDTEISYKYDATGNRIYKKVVSSSLSKETHYVRDASGNLMATYENKIAKEFVIYGSSRLGIYNGSTSEGKRILGNKKYELSNHLGNVLSVISDNKIGIGTNGVADYYEPYIISESDYYPFGMMMETRSSQNQEYAFAFQGQEKNEEIGTVHYKFRESDPVTGRFWSVDPLTASYPHNSPFAFSENRVIDGVELEGLEFLSVNDEQVNEQIFTDQAQLEIAKNNVATFEDLFYSIKNVIYMTSGIPIRDRKQADGSRKLEWTFTTTWSEAGAGLLSDLGDLMNAASLGSRGNPAALLAKTGGKGNTSKKAADAAADVFEKPDTPLDAVEKSIKRNIWNRQRNLTYQKKQLTEDIDLADLHLETKVDILDSMIKRAHKLFDSGDKEGALRAYEKINTYKQEVDQIRKSIDEMRQKRIDIEIEIDNFDIK